MKIDPGLDQLRLGSPKPLGLLARLPLDLPLLGSIALLTALALIVLYSASGQSMEVLLKQGLRLALALAVLIGVSLIHPRQLANISPILYGVGTLMLVLVLLIGKTSMGAQRWLDLGVIRFQPSELMKLATPLMLSWFLAFRAPPPGIGSSLIAGALILLPALLIAKQPDLGTAILVGSAGAAVLFLAGLSFKALAGLFLIGGASLPVLWNLLHGYQKDRILMLLNPEQDPLGRGYHIIQSKIAIGSGGFSGKGWLHGTQVHLEFLPESSTDFIFAVLAEEFGLLGCLLLLTTYGLILARCLFIVVETRDRFSRYLAGALTLTFFVYLFVNIGMVVGILPVVGVPLPLVSYGGTSTVTLFSGFGILMAIAHQNRQFEG